MKKILSIALVALLAASTVFAGFSGNAKVAFGYDSKDGKYGFDNSVSFDVDYEIASAEVEKVAEGDVYAGIKASMALKVGNLKGTTADAKIYQKDGKSDMGIGLFFKMAEAYVAGDGWKVSILGSQDAPDYAKSAIDTKEDKVKDIFGNETDDTKDVAVSYKVAANKAAGVTAEVKGFKASLGLVGYKDDSKKLNYNAFVETPSFAFADGAVSAQFAAIASGKEADTSATPAKAAYDALGASAKASYENDTFKAAVATDFGAKKDREDTAKFELGLDAAANFVISPVTVDVYYAIKANDIENLLSAKASLDLNAFDVPVSFTFTGKDLVNEQNLSAKASFTVVEGLTASVNGGYVIKTKVWNVGGDVAYAADAFTAKAAVGVKKTVDVDNLKLSASASVESSAIIPGAKLALTWKDAKDLLKKDSDIGAGKKYGKVEASCTIAF